MKLIGRYRRRGRRNKPINGFSMVEVLIAGILLASSTAAVSKISVSALSSSANISDRARIEAAINDNIQALQKEDSYFTSNWIEANQNGGLQAACSDPPQALSSHLQAIVADPRNTSVTREFDASSIPGILRVIYRFEGPEQQIKSEQRLIEMSPNFAAQCYTTQ